MAETDRFIKSNLRSWLEMRGSKNEQRPVALVLLKSDVPISAFDRSRKLLDGICRHVSPDLQIFKYFLLSLIAMTSLLLYLTTTSTNWTEDFSRNLFCCHECSRNLKVLRRIRQSRASGYVVQVTFERP